mgnify:CR=1 FL=1
MPVLDSAQAHESKIYSELSHLYDRLFTQVFADRIHAVLETIDFPEGSQVLELGIGTGLSIGAYPLDCEVTGIDLAPEMLEKAREKLRTRGIKNMRLMEMDALALDFPDDSFDFTTAFHVVSVVPDARRCLEQMVRVTRPGGTIVIINHFRSENRVLSALDTLIEPVTRRLGWPTLDLDATLHGFPLTIEQRYKDSPQSLFTILVARNAKPARGTSPSSPA